MQERQEERTDEIYKDASDLAMIMSTSTVLKKRLTIRRRWQDSSVTDISVLVLTD